MLRSIAVVIALTAASSAFAQVYVVPEGDCGATTLHATALNETIDANRVKDAYLFLPGQRTPMKAITDGRSVDFNAGIPDKGVVMATVEFTPVTSGNETRTEHAKAFVYCDAKAPAADWQRSSGLGLEIYPQWNGIVQHFKAGDSMRFIVVDKSTHKLLSDVPVQLYREGAGLIASGTPDKNGGVDFTYPQPGRYTVVTTYRRADPDQPKHWLVDTSTLTFEIK